MPDILDADDVRGARRIADVLDPALAAGDTIAPVPRVTLQAFCESHDVAAAVQAAVADRRMQKAISKVHMGGITAALESFREAPTPNVLIIEQNSDAASLVRALDELAALCDPTTRVIIVSNLNDVLFYRDLTRRGVSEYLIAPVGVIDVVRAVSGLFSAEAATQIGRTIAVVGAKGGVGASTLAHNLGWAIAGDLQQATVIVDLDLPFGTAGLDFNQDPPQGVMEALHAPERLDTAFVDRLLSRCTERLSLMAAPATLDRTVDLGEDSLDQLLDLLRGLVPTIVLDLPHQWAGWTKRAVTTADDIVIVCTPDLACLRNAKNLVDACKAGRPNDRAPWLVLNQAAMPKRPEITAADFSKAIGIEIAATIAFDAQLFGTAANNGQMIAEVQPGGVTAQQFVELAGRLTGRVEAKKAKRTLFDPIVAKLLRRKAS